MKKMLIIVFVLISQQIIGQQITDNIPKEDFERPFNFFAAAGASLRFGDLHDATISPVDYSVQFEDVFPVHTRFSMGLVWNPFVDNSEDNKKAYFDKIAELTRKGSLAYETVQAARKHLAVALLVNVAQLTFASGEVNTASPIDVGFGLGYRNKNFMILGTLEFTPMRTPRKYFLDDFLDKDRTLTLAGAQEPVRTISIEDNTLFTDKIFVSMGIKIAYAFTSENKN